MQVFELIFVGPAILHRTASTGSWVHARKPTTHYCVRCCTKLDSADFHFTRVSQSATAAAAAAASVVVASVVVVVVARTPIIIAMLNPFLTHFAFAVAADYSLSSYETRAHTAYMALLLCWQQSS